MSFSSSHTLCLARALSLCLLCLYGSQLPLGIPITVGPRWGGRVNEREKEGLYEKEREREGEKNEVRKERGEAMQRENRVHAGR